MHILPILQMRKLRLGKVGQSAEPERQRWCLVAWRPGAALYPPGIGLLSLRGCPVCLLFPGSSELASSLSSPPPTEP